VLVRPNDAAALDNWLAGSQRVLLASLLSDLPRDALGSLTVAFDAEALRKGGTGTRLASFYPAIAGHCTDAGMGLEQQIVPRLKGVGGVQVVALPRRIGSAYVAKTKSERDAQRVFSDC